MATPPPPSPSPRFPIANLGRLTRLAAVTTAFSTAPSRQQRDFFTTTGLDGSAARKAVLASRRSTPPFSINPRTDSAMTPQMTDTAGPTADSLVHLTSWRHRNRDAATVAATATKLRGGKGSTAGRDVTTRFGRRLFGSRSSSNDHGDPETSNGGSVPPGTGGMGRWGWGGGGGGGGRGGDGEEGDGRGDFVALGAAQVRSCSLRLFGVKMQPTVPQECCWCATGTGLAACAWKLFGLHGVTEGDDGAWSVPVTSRHPFIGTIPAS